MTRSLLAFFIFSLSAPLLSDTWTDYTTGIMWTYKQSQGKVTIGSGYNNNTAVPKKTKGDLVVPDFIAGYPVIGVAGNAFYGCGSLKSITLPETVTSIGGSAFKSCSELKSVNVPSGITKINSETFAYCSALTSVILPEGVTEIGENAFNGCKSLTFIELPSTLQTIKLCAFYGCSALASISLPEGLISIEDSVFFGCSSLIQMDELTFPSTLTELANFASSPSPLVQSIRFNGPVPSDDFYNSLNKATEHVYYTKQYEKDWEYYFRSNAQYAPVDWHCIEDYVNVIVTPTITGAVPFNCQAFQWGDEVSITANSTDDYIFLGWGSNQPNLGGADATLTFKMPENEVTLVATFLPKALLEGLIDKQIDGRIDGEALLTKEQAVAKTEAVIEEKKEAGELFDRAGVEAEVEESIAEKVASKELVTRESIREMALGAPVIEVDGGQAKVGISLRKANALDGAWEEVTPGQAEVEGQRVKVTVDAKDGAAFYKFVVPDGEQSQTK